MGTKISALTETGSAPTGAYYPLEYDNANYKISTETLRANLGGKYTADWATSHGGVTVANGATLTITHNLGTTDVIVQAYVNSSASDTNAQALTIGAEGGSSGSILYGGCITNRTNNALTLQLGAGGYFDMDSSGEMAAGTSTPFTDLFIKVVVLSAGSGNAARAYIAFDGTGTIAASTEYNIASLTDDGVGLYTVAFTTAIANPVPNVSVIMGGTSINTSALRWPYVESITSSSITIRIAVADNGGDYAGTTDPSFVSLVVF